ncbi:lysophospholipid transporter LplT [Betaproteobacteria bacterium LSUCC0115]|nr:lysophospholipid transporter LplT [Burkholderiales bacterium LSUCC0115]
MKRGFYTIMSAQFLSSLADNALLIAAIALLIDLSAPEWMRPLLKLFFTISYVVLAPFVGAFADAMPKGKVMLITNTIKIVGCGLLFFHIHPLLAYAVVGLGAAAYSPAKYGILTELLPPEKLVAANGWIEGTTVGSIILGTMLGGALISPSISGVLLSLDFPGLDTGIDTAAESAIAVIAFIYLLAAAFNAGIPDTGARYAKQSIHPIELIKAFWHCNQTLWGDKLGQISLAVTTLFWGAGATLQFIVLKWAEVQLGMSLDKAAILQGIVAVGIAGGAVAAARFVSLKGSCRVLVLGVLMGLTVPLMTLVTQLDAAIPLLVLVGILAGFFVVPMNALLQHRGHVLLSAGHSIAVQNFNENLNVLVMLGLYALLIHLDMHVNAVIILFGGFVALTMALVMVRYRYNQRHHDLQSLIGQEKSGHGAAHPTPGH